MRIVALEREIAELELEDRLHGGIDGHGRQRTRLALELESGLLEMVRVEMRVAEGVDEFSWLEVRGLRDHHGQERERSDVERDAEKDVGAALIHLTGEPA